ncbi:hypothetical protein [Desulfosporosinus metallidurans]|uniref:Uncharacterized protein n=1 Tax=Desulfosporosinus metallidurans TaxID=1888891 RepID=A0A1Q8R2E0_9FIRM|nr:hypothetical protein [Desulfosporosinus metallidurans]OLN33833.1 hypothetical protein DSOL_0011 [Desulfosporosinus metallidurans]
MLNAEMDKVIGGYMNRIANLSPCSEDYEYRKQIIEDEIQDFVRHESVMAEHQQLGRNKVAFERALARAENDEKKK